jgi:hypothetical protein
MVATPCARLCVPVCLDRRLPWVPGHGSHLRGCCVDCYALLSSTAMNEPASTIARMRHCRLPVSVTRPALPEGRAAKRQEPGIRGTRTRRPSRTHPLAGRSRPGSPGQC